ncbi:MAG: NAD-dependent epimerase/dehydratase family protein [Planctomycetota bacterium]|jgi:dihydroflavonol-4-reductase
MQVLVTGANGHVGAALCRQLIEAGHRVRALVFEPSAVLEGLDLDEVRGDITRPHTLEEPMRNVEVVFHLASLISIDPKDAPRQHLVNALGARNVAEAALAAGVRRVMHFSSIEAFQLEPKDRPLLETRARVDEPGANASAYAHSKALGERAVRSVGNKGLEVVVVHPVGVAGPYDLGRSLIGALLRDLYLGKRPIVVRGCFDWVDCRDVARGALAAATLGRDGESYILGGHRASVVELNQLVHQAGGRRSRLLALPVELVQLAVPFMHLAARLSRRRALMTRHSLNNLNGPPPMCWDKAERELGYKVRPLAHTVSDAIGFYKQSCLL